MRGCCDIFAGMAACCEERAKNTPFGKILKRATRKPFLAMLKYPTCWRKGFLESFRSPIHQDRYTTNPEWTHYQPTSYQPTGFPWFCSSSHFLRGAK